MHGDLCALGGETIKDTLGTTPTYGGNLSFATWSHKVDFVE